MDILPEMPEIVRQYALYYRNIKGRAPKTVNEYCSDLRTFLRFMKHFRGYVSQDTPMEEIPIGDIDLEFIRSITAMDIFEFMNYAADGRSNMSSTRQRKSSSLKSFFNYLTVHEGLLDSNPTENLTPPKKAKTLPRYLTLEQSRELLNAVDGPDKERDYCILTLFLNCGMRLSELVSINMSDVIHNNSTLRIVGKGSKERIVYLNDACLASIDAYVRVRPKDDVKDKNALFISNRGTRISPKTVQAMVNKYLTKIGLGGVGREAVHAMVKKTLLKAGLDPDKYSSHKLRHTAATLMYQYGNVDIRVLQDILGHENLGTTEIYTHTSSKQMEDAVNANPLSKMREKTDKNE